MQKILILVSVLTALVTTGCIGPERDRHDHDRHHEDVRYERQSGVNVEPPIVVVRPAEVIVR